MLKRDRRGRLRVTVDGVRVEVNRNNELRVYRRYTPHENAERRRDVLNGDDAWSLSQALIDIGRTIRDERW